MKISLVLLAGGKGARMGFPTPKQFLPLSNKAIALHSLEVLQQFPEIEETIVVCAPEYRPIFDRFKVKFALPGAERQDSLQNGLQLVSSQSEWVCTHDAARPFITSQMVKTLFERGLEVGAASLAMPVKNTLKETTITQQVATTLDRSRIWEIQTPQLIKKEILEAGFAYAQKHALSVTDDVSLAELVGHPVQLVTGGYQNIKITTPEDLFFAEWWIEEPGPKGLRDSFTIKAEELVESLPNPPLKERDCGNVGSKKYRMRISYDGTDYSGWQVQPNGVSIQGLIENALQTRLATPVRVVGSGRTDAGVHAMGQVAHFTTETPFNCYQMLHALNGLLPSTIRIKELMPVAEAFHAQYSALSKEYHYHLWLEKTIDPFYRLYRHHFCYTRFSLARLREGAKLFLGTHDFVAFANTGSTVVNTIRTLSRLDIQEQEGGVRLEFEGDGFLYKMVRNIVGTLLEVATERRAMSQIPEIFSSKDRRKAAAAAPPKGLFLMKITYPESL